MLDSNRTLNPVHSSSESNGFVNGMIWGGVKGAGIGSAYSAVNQYMLTGDLKKMGKLDGHIPLAAEFWRESEKGMRGYDKIVNHQSVDEGLLKQKSPLAKMAYNSTFGHGMKGNLRRIGVSAAVGAVFGGLHTSSDGVIG